jgi:hypothetical protein
MSVERVRAGVRAAPGPSSLLQRGVPTRCLSLAPVACGPAVAKDFAGPGLPSGAELPAPEAGQRAATGRDFSGGTGCRRGLRGPAPSACRRKNLLQSARLLRLIYCLAAIALAALLFLLLPSGFTTRGTARETVGAAAKTIAATRPGAAS